MLQTDRDCLVNIGGDYYAFGVGSDCCSAMHEGVLPLCMIACMHSALRFSKECKRNPSVDSIYGSTITVNDLPCIAEQNATQSVSVATQKSSFC